MAPQNRLHTRCGTSYLLLVMVISTLVYSCVPVGDSLLLRMGVRILLLPLVAGVSYEVLKLLAKGDSLFARILRWPGLQLQRLTTAEPDAGMMEVAIVAFEAALGEKSPEEVEALRVRYARGEAAARQQAQEIHAQA